jgi:hypothetical protein
MPYPKLAEGNRVFDAVFDAETNFADWNELQDQLLGMMGPLAWNINLMNAVTLTADWAYNDADPAFWEAANAATVKVLRIPIPWIRSGMKLTRIKVAAGGNSVAGDDGDGSIGIYRHPIGAAGTAAGAAIAVVTSQPFRTDPNYALHDSGALALTLDGTYQYYLRVLSAYDAGTPPDSRLLGAYATVQFGA